MCPIFQPWSQMCIFWERIFSKLGFSTTELVCFQIYKSDHSSAMANSLRVYPYSYLSLFSFLCLVFINAYAFFLYMAFFDKHVVNHVLPEGSCQLYSNK